MTLPFASSFGVMRLFNGAGWRVEHLVFVLLLIFCAVGQWIALSRLLEDCDSTPNWRLLTYALKVVAFVCLVFFTASAAIAGYTLLTRRPPPSTLRGDVYAPEHQRLSIRNALAISIRN